MGAPINGKSLAGRLTEPEPGGTDGPTADRIRARDPAGGRLGPSFPGPSADAASAGDRPAQRSAAGRHRSQAQGFQPAPRGRKGELFNPQDPTRKSTAARHLPSQSARSNRPHAGGGAGIQAWLEGQPDAADQAEVMIKQPNTRPISQEQLVAEVKGIYAGLVMVESKCIEVDNAQSGTKDTATHSRLNHEQWQALIALHRTLLHEHHDFFLASQHPAASHALRRLASKYAMPARMWRHGIHSFLELLRHRLPASLEHMLTFIYLAYSMMALLYETVPAFEETWIECLGDLGRYRMAIEDDDIRDREVWTSVSRHWYSKASDKAPTTGRLYHHLAILARPIALQQLFYYGKSLCVAVPFLSAKESIMTLFDPILSGQAPRLQAIDIAYVKAQGIMFSGRDYHLFDSSVNEFLDLLDNHIGRTTRGWIESGYFISISLCCALVEFGEESNPLMQAMKEQRLEDGPGSSTTTATTAAATDTTMEGTQTEAQAVATATSNAGDKMIPAAPSKRFQDAIGLAVRTHDVVFRRFGDPNILPYLHTTMAFVLHMSAHPAAMVHLEPSFPWKLLSLMLNSLLGQYSAPLDRIESDSFPRPESVAPTPAPIGPSLEMGVQATIPPEQIPRPPTDKPPQPLPEDFAMRGLVWAEDYFPTDWFSGERVDDDEKYFEMPSMGEERKERILWIACRLAAQERWLLYDRTARHFTVTAPYDVEMDPELLQGAEEDATMDDDEDEDDVATAASTPKQGALIAGGGVDFDISDAPTLLR